MTIQKRLSIGGMILMLMTVILAYSNTFRGPFQLDEGLFISSNPLITSETSDTYWYYQADIERTNAHRIIAILSYLANYKIHGLSVEGYHVVNLVIHLCSALLAYILIIQIFSTPAIKGTPSGAVSEHIAFFTALLFAVHPVQTESVTYIAGRFISLTGMFYMLTVVLYAQGRLVSLEAHSRGLAASSLWYIGSLGAAVCGMLTKENAFTVPIIVSLYEFLFFRGDVRSRLVKLLPMFMTLAVIPFISFFVLDWSFDQATWAGKHLSMGISRIEYLFTQFTVIMTYLRLLVLPVNQNFLYDYPAYTSFLDPPVLLSSFFLLLLLLTGAYLIYRSRTGDRRLRVVAFGIFWFFISLSVESSIIPIYNFYLCEYRLYTPSVGLILSATTTVFLLVEPSERKLKQTVVVLGIAAALLAYAAYARNSLWKDAASLWNDVVIKSPRLFMPRNKLGMAYMASGDYDAAIDVFRTIHQLGEHDPDRYRRLLNGNSTAIARQIAVAHLRKGRPGEAFAEFSKMLGTDAATAHYLFANICYQEGFRDLAVTQLTAALNGNPRLMDARILLQAIDRETGRE